MKLKSLKNFVFTLILVLSVSRSTFASTTDTQINKTVDGVKATLTFSTQKVKLGNNDFTIFILDKNGNPLPNLKVTAYADDPNGTDGMTNTSGASGMAGMPGMSGMSASDMPMIALKDGSTKGEYTGMVNFKSTGKWIVESTFDVKGQSKTIDFNVNAQGPNFLIIGVGFLGVIVLIIAIAALNKKKSIKS
ncbi:FixH family protein [Clostridium estertheticum]|uniref:FixH family protein n=1 Tax=Clostridium estertheticum TaxID=238834 RepID=UPI001CF379AA|nr:FixH family protein [Clostridium estertheticum]MCB2353596.1 FixH family protein [Clostridium estertheticum]WAG40694.1 FixH family protein [Clostridium estertheticum]